MNQCEDMGGSNTVRTMIPSDRLRIANDRPLRPQGSYILYWMVAHRRLGWNWALQHAVEEAGARHLPLLVFEPLGVGAPWASARFHHFLLQGMREHRDRLARHEVAYFPYVEPALGAGEGLLEALSSQAALVVTDDHPTAFESEMIRRAGGRLDVRLHAVDSNGLLPMAATTRAFTTAYSFRRFLQKTLPDHLPDQPQADPLEGGLPSWPEGGFVAPSRWPEADLDALLLPGGLEALPIDQRVAPTELRGGTEAGRAALNRFLRQGLHRYAGERNHPDEGSSSGLSPWLARGHLSSNEVLNAVTRMEGWTPMRLSGNADGKRHGWWGLSENAESFLDQLVTWREIGFNMCKVRPEDFDRYESLPDWVLATLAEHADDRRPHSYALEEFDEARTHDPLWNAAQRQLRSDGVIQNYLRMLWGKKILEWSSSPQMALEIMIELNNRYALDGCDPNSYSGIFWVLGRYDRGWPERSVFGKVRSMSSDSTRRKVRLANYMERYGS